MRKLFKQFLFIAALTLSVGFLLQSLIITAFAQNKTTLNQKQAVEIAERFIAANGYTEAPVNRNTKLYLEAGENSSDIEDILAARLRSIESRAMIALVKEVDGQSFWSVQFLLRKEKIESGFLLGREVKVSLNGNRIWLNPEAIPVLENKVLICIDDEDDKGSQKPL